MRKLLLAAPAAMLALAACSSGTTSAPEPAASCTPISAAAPIVADFADGLTPPGLTNFVSLPMPPSQRTSYNGWPHMLYAGQLSNGKVAIWGQGNDRTDDGPTLAVNSSARDASVYGSAARPGSEADTVMIAAARSAAAGQIEACVTALSPTL